MDSFPDLTQFLLSNYVSSLYDKNVPKIDRETLIQYIEGILYIKSPTSTLINKIKSFYETKRYLPETIDEFSKWHLTSCLCGRINDENLEKSIETCSYILSRESRIPSCQEVLLYIEYYNQERRFPTSDEIVEYIQNLENLYRNPEEFHLENKVKICTPNLHLLKSEKNDHEDNCGLCFECISHDEECYKLPCGHKFHSESKKCLDDTIVRWLSENKTCPICKQEVNLK
jgi:hypothetical protein